MTRTTRIHRFVIAASFAALLWPLACAVGQTNEPSAATEKKLRVSHREVPTAWAATEVSSGPVAGPDGKVYFVTAGKAPPRFVRFDPGEQRFEALADLGSLPSTNGPVGREVGVVAPVVFDRHANAWLGTMAFPLKTEDGQERRSGRLLRFSTRGKASQAAIVEVEGRSVIALGIDARRDRLLLLGSDDQETRWFRYDVGGRTWKGCVTVAGRPHGALVMLADGSAVVIDEKNTIYRFDPEADELRAASTVGTGPGEAAQGVCALVASDDGKRVYGVTRAGGRLFEYDPSAGTNGTVRDLGPTFGDESVPGVAPTADPRMALCLGTNRHLYYAGYGNNRGMVARCDAGSGARALLGAMASEWRVLVPPLAGGACGTRDGRVYVGGFGQPGCGLYVFPPLPEQPPWSNANREYRCPAVRRDGIRIDGELDEETWQHAPRMDGFVNTAIPPQPGRWATSAYLAWTETHLYFAFACQIDQIRSQAAQRDDDIWLSECAELFVCPRGADARYYEVDVNPQKTLFDNRLLGYTYLEQEKTYKDWARAWNPEVVCETKLTRDRNGKLNGWTLEGSVPFEAFEVPAPRKGDVWLFNAMRVVHLADNQLEFQSWHPMYGEFHRPHQFPKLRFVR